MSTNCIRCGVNKRTGPDLMCDDCAKRPDTEVVGRLFLELSQFTNAETAREGRLRRLCALSQQAMELCRRWLTEALVYKIPDEHHPHLNDHCGRMAGVIRQIEAELKGAPHA